MPEPPPPSVLAEFGVSGRAVPLAGGQGSAWRAGDLVLKPLDVLDAQLEWQAELVDSLATDEFRVARPLRARGGSFAAEGWTAWEALDGRHEERRWEDVIAVGERFHAALQNVERPAFVGERTDKWAVGDRVAWGELPWRDFEPVKHLERLVSALRPIAAPSQLIHGDLTGNVLFHDTLPPAVIDLSLCWRPTAYASAVVVGDALIWEGADESLLVAVADVEDFPQYLLRALIFRAVVDRAARLDEPLRPDDDDPYLPAVELAYRLAR